MARQLKSQHVIERLRKVESGMLQTKSEFRKEVKSTHKEEQGKEELLILI